MLGRGTLLSSLVAGAVALGGCGLGASESVCNKGALKTLSAELETLDKREGLELVAPRIEAACAEALPDPVRLMLGLGTRAIRSTSLAAPDERFRAMAKRACPEGERAMRVVAESPAAERPRVFYQACKLDRYEVLAAHEVDRYGHSLASWTMHQWFLDQGLTPDEARPITRALLVHERMADSLVSPIAGQELPRASGAPFRDAHAVYVSSSELIFAGRKLVALKKGIRRQVEGHLIDSLHEAMSEEVEKAREMAEMTQVDWDGRLLVVADRGLPFGTLVDIAYTAAEAGYLRFALAVEAGPLEFEQIEFFSPRFDSTARAQPDLSPLATVEIWPTGYSIGGGGGEVERRNATPLAHEGTPGEAIDVYASRFLDRDASAHRAVISAQGRVRLESIVDAMARLRGTTCGQGSDSCLLPDLALTLAPAHGFFPDAILPEGGKAFVTSPARGAGELGPSALRVSGGPPRPGGSSTDHPRVDSVVPRVEGKLDAEVIDRIVRAHRSEVRGCYAQGRVEDLGGQLAIAFSITGRGKVADVRVVQTLADEKVVACVAKAVARWRFPAPSDAKAVTVEQAWTLGTLPDSQADSPGVPASDPTQGR
jgi:hypothetical protein